MGHLFMATIQWIPLYVLLLLKMVDTRKIKWAVLCGLGWTLVVLDSFYHGFFLLVFTAVFSIVIVGFRSFKERKLFIEYKSVGIFCIPILIGMFSLIPLVYQVFQAFLFPDTEGAVKVETVMPMTPDLHELWVYGARWYDYLVPSVLHPVFKHFSLPFLESNLHSNPIEQNLFMGYIPLLLVIGLVYLKLIPQGQIQNEGEKRRWVDMIVPIFLTSFFVSILLSFPPYFDFLERRWYLPTFYIFKVVPFFRVYARFAILAQLSLAVLAGYCVFILMKRIQERSIRAIVLIFLSAGIIFEFCPVPPFHFTYLKKPPALYEWLKDQPGDFAVVEYPWYASIAGEHYYYLLWQRVHEKRMVNGAKTGTLREDLRVSLQDLEDPGTVKILGRLGVKYILYHLNLGSLKLSPLENLPDGLRFVTQFGNTVVYENKTMQPDLPPPPLDVTLSAEIGREIYHPGETAEILARIQRPDESPVSGEYIFGFISSQGESQNYPLAFRDLGNGTYQSLYEIQPEDLRFGNWNIKVYYPGMKTETKYRLQPNVEPGDRLEIVDIPLGQFLSGTNVVFDKEQHYIYPERFREVANVKYSLDYPSDVCELMHVTIDSYVLYPNNSVKIYFPEKKNKRVRKDVVFNEGKDPNSTLRFRFGEELKTVPLQVEFELYVDSRTSSFQFDSRLLGLQLWLICPEDEKI